MAGVLLTYLYIPVNVHVLRFRFGVIDKPRIGVLGNWILGGSTSPSLQTPKPKTRVEGLALGILRPWLFVARPQGWFVGLRV